MIKLKTLIPEAYKHYLYGDDTSHWTVKKPFDVFLFGDKSIPTGQWSTAGPGGNKMIYTKEKVRYRLKKGQQITNFPGGVFLIDYKTKWAAAVMALFTFAVAIIFHSDFSEGMQMIFFLKDIAIAGGFMIIIAYGPGKISLDHYFKSKQE